MILVLLLTFWYWKCTVNVVELGRWPLSSHISMRQIIYFLSKGWEYKMYNRANLAGGYFPTHFLLAMKGDRTWQEATFYPYIRMLNNFIRVKGVGDTICRFLRFPGFFLLLCSSYFISGFGAGNLNIHNNAVLKLYFH